MNDNFKENFMEYNCCFLLRCVVRCKERLRKLLNIYHQTQRKITEYDEVVYQISLENIHRENVNRVMKYNSALPIMDLKNNMSFYYI